MTLLSRQTGPRPSTAVRYPCWEPAVQLIVMGFPQRESIEPDGNVSLLCLYDRRPEPGKAAPTTASLRGRMHNPRGTAAAYTCEEYGCAVGFPGRNSHLKARRPSPRVSTCQQVATSELTSWAARPSRMVRTA